MKKVMRLFLLWLLAIETSFAKITFVDYTATIDINSTGTFWVASGNRMSQIDGYIQTTIPENVISGKLFFNDGYLAFGSY